MNAYVDTGDRRRSADAPPRIADLIDEATIQSIAEEAWSALVGEDEYLVPLPGDPLVDAVSSWSAPFLDLPRTVSHRPGVDRRGGRA